MTLAALRALYPPRPADARKGDRGRVVVAGGSDRYTGVLALNALAALVAGADLAIVVAPRRAADIVASMSPDLIAIPTRGSFPDPAAVLREARRADALVLGGGVERTPAAHAALRRIVRACDAPMVLDAEALHAIGPAPGILRGKTALLTPNAAEYEALAGSAWPANERARRPAAKALAHSRGASILVKGRWDVASDGARTQIDPAGSPYLTKGGHGDVLAGVCGTFLARGASPYDAARAGALLAGRAGELAAKERGESTLATAVLARIPDALRALLSRKAPERVRREAQARARPMRTRARDPT